MQRVLRVKQGNVLVQLLLSLTLANWNFVEPNQLVHSAGHSEVKLEPLGGWTLLSKLLALEVC